MKKLLIAVLALVMALSFGLVTAVPAAADGPTPTTLDYGDVSLSGGFQAGHFPQIWNLTACDLVLSFTYDANGLVDDSGAHAWAELGVREVGYGDFNPTWQVEGAGVWLATDYDSAVGTFDPDPPGSPTLDIDDKLILQKAGGHGEGDYNLPSTPPNPSANHRIWFDRDGVDQWQAQNPLAFDGGTYNTGGTYDVVITLHADSATSGTAYMTINGLSQGFETDANWNTMELSPAGMTFTGDMAQMQVFYGLYGDGATHSVAFNDITVTGCPTGGFVTGGGWINSPAGAYMPSDTVVVTEANVDVDWFRNDTRCDGYVAFVEGPGNPPLGSGSLEMGTTASQDKAQLFNYDHIDTLLADIEGISYATYRHSSSTNSAAQYPAINIEVDYVGDGSSYTTLVWEPVYAYANLAVDAWQTWDTMAPSQTPFQGGWWSTRDIPGVCAFNCFVDWDTIVQNNPNAKINYGFGVNVGSGWVGTFTGAVDALTLSVTGDTIIYDFEPVAPPTGKATFGFVSKYKKGATVPTGQTEFVFRAADLNFHSSSYDWLVIAGDTARYKGWGTVNGAGNYRFMLWAKDGDPDTFRIKIWTEVNDVETVVYDNGSHQPIGGGNIVVHKKK